MKQAYIVAVVMLLNCISCRDKFEADLQSMDRTFLVVEGNLNAGADSTIIRLTRTLKLEDAAKLVTENNAIITVEGEDNTTRTLIGRSNGYYVSPRLNLIIGTGYRMRIKTVNGKEYLSDFVKARVTPPVDSLNWEEIDKQVVMYTNTHDPSGNSRYYRWEYDETWQIRSYFFSTYVYDNGNVRPRNIPGEEVFDCWKYDTSKTILLANSKGLQDDKIYRSVLTRIPVSSEKLTVRYSMQVRQYALDKDAYDFYELMKRNTEEIGSIFTPQPSELIGNIRCINDPSEYILGYITASTVQKLRKFVVFPRPEYRLTCEVKNVPMIRDSIEFYFRNGDYIPFDFDMTMNHYPSSLGPCVDCRRRGGSLIKPSYW